MKKRKKKKKKGKGRKLFSSFLWEGGGKGGFKRRKGEGGHARHESVFLHFHAFRPGGAALEKGGREKRRGEGGLAHRYLLHLAGKGRRKGKGKKKGGEGVPVTFP